MTDYPLVLRQAAATARLTRDLPHLVRNPMSADEAARRVRTRLRDRESSWLRLIRRTIYGRAASPYRRLLQHAGCTCADLAEQVRRDGLEATLQRLAAAGVYMTQAEMKGRSDIVRGSLRFRANPSAFDNPLNRPHFVVPTSGSSGAQLWTGRSLAELSEIGDVLSSVLETGGMAAPAYVKWSTLPHAVMENLHLGIPVVGWFDAIPDIPVAVRALQWWVWAVVRASGGRIARPRLHRLTDAETMAARLVALLRTHPQILMDATVSSATRVAAVAAERGISLRGLCWMAWGEPLMPAREQIITASGATTLPVYSMVETGPMAMACAARTLPDAMHLRRERFAIVRRTTDRQPVTSHAADGGSPAGALLVTTLGRAAPKILLNAETGDAADMLNGLCGCALDALGLTERIAHIWSFEKLTGEGVTLIGTDLVALIEETLPRLLGGRPGDFQLLEAEGPSGSTRLVLRVRPSEARPPIDTARAKEILLDGIAAQSPGSAHMARLLQAASAIEVERAAPWVTPSGKIPAFVPLRSPRDG